MEQSDIDLVLGALDSLGVALADHDHQWTEGERAIYDRSAEIVAEQRQRSEKEWECPDCHTRYIKDVGRCGELRECSRPNVVPASAPASRRPAVVGGTAAVATSEPQEQWSIEPVLRADGSVWEGLAYINVGDSRGLGSVNKSQGEAIVAAHNAAISAERKAHQLLEWQHGKSQRLIRKLGRKLAAELERRELMVAALKAVRVGADTLKRRAFIDAALALATANRLVEALEEIANGNTLDAVAMQLIADAALAQVKDSPWRAKEQP